MAPAARRSAGPELPIGGGAVAADAAATGPWAPAPQPLDDDHAAGRRARAAARPARSGTPAGRVPVQASVPSDAAAARPVAGSGAPTQGGFFWAGSGAGTAGKLSVAVAGAVTVIGTAVPVPVKPVYSVPLTGPALTVSVPPVVVAGTVKE